MIAIVGSLNMDLVVKTERIPRPGETVMGLGFRQIPGGKGANQADAAAKLGAEVLMIGCVGDDAMGELLRSSLAKDGVLVDHISTISGVSTGVAAILVESSGNNSITVAPGANRCLTTSDIKGLEPILAQSNILLTQLETPLETVKESLTIARQHGIKTILNPAPAVDLEDEILKRTDLLTPNETELERLTSMPTTTIQEIEAAGMNLLERGVKELIVTLGEKGCLYLSGDQKKQYPAYPVKAVDTTAAGDSFNAALAVSLSQGKSMEEAISFAMKVGAMTVTKEGAQTSLPLLSEVEAFDGWIKTQGV